jgi:hypothetical protein
MGGVRRSNKDTFYMFLLEYLPGDTTPESLDERKKVTYARVCYNFREYHADSCPVLPDKLEIPEERYEANRLAFKELECTLLMKDAIPIHPAHQLAASVLI